MFILDLYDFGFGIKEFFSGVGAEAGHRTFNSFLFRARSFDLRQVLFYKGSEV
jgi:hypothetical protein